MAVVYLGLGSNLGDRNANLRQALDLLSREVVMEKVSSVYETEPVGYQEQPPFLNAVCRVSTVLRPEKLLELAKQIEARLGRRPGFVNAPRPIDIDVLLYNGEVIRSPGLIVPHPRMAGRAFVLVPLAEIAPDLVHPETGRSISEMVRDLGAIAGVRKLY